MNRIILVFTVLAITTMGFAQGTYTSTGVTSDWNVTTTWSGDGNDSPNDGIPDANDNVIIANGHTVNVNVVSASGNLTMNGTAILTGVQTLAISGILTLNGNSQVSTGTYTVAGGFNVPAAQIGTFGGINITINAPTTIGGYFYLGISGTGNKTFNGTITVNGGGTWDNVVGEDPNINCSIINNGSWPVPTGGNGRYNVVSGGPYTYTGNTEIAMTRLNLQNSFTSTVTNLGILRLTKNGVDALTVANASATFNNGNGVAAALLRVESRPTTVSANGTVNFANANNTVEYLYAGNQDVYNSTYYNLTCSTSGIKTLAGNTTVTNTLTTSGSAILDANNKTLNGTANLTMTGTSELRLSKNGVTLPELTGVTNSLSAGTTITFNGSGSQTARSNAVYPYQNVNISGAGGSSIVDFSNVANVAGNLSYSNTGQTISNPVLTVGGTFNYNSSATTTLSNNLTTGNFIFSNGTLNYSNRTITINGNNGTWTFNGGGSFVNALSTVIFTTGTNQLITGTASTSFVNLVINNSNNVTLSGADASVTTGLTLTSGNIVTGSRVVYIPSGGTVTPTAGWINGNLKKDIPLGSPSVTFEVGGATAYAPVNLNFTSVTTAAAVTVTTIDGIHPDINGSNLEPNKSVNRYWTVTNNGTVFSSYDATFNYVNADKDPLFTPASAVIKRTNGIAWFATTTGTLTANSSQFTGELSANLPNNVAESFAIGNDIVTTGIFNSQTGAGLLWNDKTTWIQNRTGNIQFTNGSTAVTGTGTDFVAELVNGDVIMLQTNPILTQRYTVVSRTATTMVISPAATVTSSGGYGREYVPNSINDVVTIGNTNIGDATTTIGLNMSATVNSLNINLASGPRNTSHNLTQLASNVLTVQTNVVINQPGAAGTDAWNINAASAVVNGNVTIGSALAGATKIARLVITTGSLTVNNLIYNTTSSSGDEAMAVLDMSGGAGGVVNLKGSFNFVNGRGRLIPGAGANSTINFTRTSSGQTLDMTQPNSNAAAANFVYSNLLFNNTHVSGVTITAASISAANVTGNFRIQTGTVFTDDNVAIVGNAARTFQIDPGAAFEMKGASATFPTGYGTFSLGTAAPFGTVRYNQPSPAAITIANRNFGNLTVLRSGVAFSLPNAALSIAGSLTLGDGTSSPSILGSGGATVPTIGRDVIINANATLDATTPQIATINVGGNWTNNGTFSSGGGGRTVVFTGASPTQPQVISGTTATSFNNLTINSANTTDIVQMNAGVTVSSVLTLTKGGLSLNGNTLSVTSSATTAIVSGGTFPSQGYIKSETTSAPYGDVKWTTSNVTGSFIYPFGKSSTEFIPVTINKTTGGAPAGGTISVWTYSTANNNTPLPSGVTNLNGTSGGNSVADRFWGMTLNGYTGTKPTATLTFTAVGGSAPTGTPPSERPGTINNLATVVTSPAGIVAQDWNPASYWDSPASGQTFANNAPNTGFFQVTLPGALLLNSYVPWALADAAFPLPIELTDFEAIAEQGSVLLNWKTATELNNDFFTVEKMSLDEKFIPVVTVKGAGTKTSESVYSARDLFPKAGVSYYRLKQTDFNGAATYSKIVKVDVNSGLLWQVYPNPTRGTDMSVEFSPNEVGKDVNIKLLDMSGHLMFENTILKLDTTRVKVEMLQPLPSGFYLISLTAGDQIVRQKVVVN